MTREEKLVLLIEECGEVIQAATKCLRFGWERNHPDYGINHEVLAAECGDAIGVIRALGLDWEIVHGSSERKMAKAERVKAELAG
jgi:hypothetical protein